MCARVCVYSGMDCPGQLGPYGITITLAICWVDILITSGMLQPWRSGPPCLPWHFKPRDRLLGIMQNMDTSRKIRPTRKRGGGRKDGTNVLGLFWCPAFSPRFRFFSRLPLKPLEEVESRRSIMIRLMAGQTHTNIHRGPLNRTNTNHTLLGEAQANSSRIDLWVH